MEVLQISFKEKDKVITKCDNSLEVLDGSSPPTPAQGGLPLGEGVGGERRNAKLREFFTDDENDKLYYAVLSFPQSMKFKLKVKNKMKTEKYGEFTTKQQHVIFKRHIDEWRAIARKGIRVIPEYTKSGSFHFNIIYASSETIRDQKITFHDAYNIPFGSEFKQYFTHIQEVNDLKELLTNYLMKEGDKKYQYTGIIDEYVNV